jgi:hypothetical protein
VYWASPGSTDWHTTPEVAGKGKALSAPAITEVGGVINIAVEGPGHSLILYLTVKGTFHWESVEIPGPVAYSAPSATTMLVDRSYLEHIAVEGPGHTLNMYVFNGRHEIYSHIVGGPGTTFSAPSIGVLGGATDVIAAQGPANSLDVYTGFPELPGPGGPPWARGIAARQGTTFSAPSVTVPGGYVTISVQGPDHSLRLYWSDLGGQSWGVDYVASAGTTYSAPSIAQNGNWFNPPTPSTNWIGVTATGPRGSLRFYWARNQTGPWTPESVAGSRTVYTPPAILPEGTRAAITAIGPGGRLASYQASTACACRESRP